MKNVFHYVFILILICGFVVVQDGYANIWIDEDFEDGVAFGPAGVDIDTYSFNAIANPLNITENGSLSSARAFEGSGSYQLTAGQSVVINEPFQDQANGPIQYLQFAVSVGQIPTTPGTFAELRWNWRLNINVDHSFFVRLDSDGSQVSIVAGEDLATSTSGVLETLTDTNTWTYITIQIQKNANAENDSRTEINQSGVAQGAYFYSSSSTPGVTVVPSGTPDSDGQSNDWSLTVSDGEVFIDDVYWEGGMTDALDGSMSVPPDTDNIRPLDKAPPVSVPDWNQY